MPFEAYLPAGFSLHHENLMFDALARSLEAVCASKPEPHVLVGNMTFDGVGLDAVFLKPDAVCVVELKNYGGMIHFSENFEWFADEVTVQGGGDGNPFQQVRRYKFTLMDYLRRRQNQFLRDQREVNWYHISGLVLFGQDIHFDEQLPPGIGRWFHICDQRTAATRLLGLHSRELRLLPDELTGIIRCLELRPQHRYTGSAPQAATFIPPGAQPAKRRFRIIYHRDSRFRECQARMRSVGGPKCQGAVQVLRMLEDTSKGVNVFATLPTQADTRIPNSAIYNINQHCHLMALVLEDSLYPWFLGDPAEVAQWIAANEGLTLAVDGATGRISVTAVGSPLAAENLQPATFTSEKLPLLNRVAGLDLENLVPQTLIRRHLAALTEETSEEEIMEVLELIGDIDLRAFLFDVINLVRAGDVAGAETRLRLRNGEAAPVAEAPGLAADSVETLANSDQVIVWSELTENEKDILLDPKRFQEWMLLLHPDQKKVAEADYEKPVVLTGVSGSGKTCILIHRARYLARKYPNERIGVLTLNRSLAHLLRNLVKQLCLDGEDRSIHVFAFYDYFRVLLHELGPDKYLDQLAELATESQHLRCVLQQVDRGNLANEIDTRSGETLEDTWNDFYDQQHPDLRSCRADIVKYLEEYRIDASRYLREEFTLIRSAMATAERTAGYATFDRAGRSIPLQLRQRQDILRLLLFYEEYMLAGGMLDVLELTQALLPLWREIREVATEKRFRCVLVDEFQDFSSLDLRLIRHLAPSAENGLFLDGDPVQKILVKRLKLADATLDRGSAWHVQIRKNYRNSRQILKAASALANRYADMARKLGEEIEALDPELAVRETTAPIALKTDKPIKKTWEIAKQCMENAKTQAWTICIATAAPESISTQELLWHAPPEVSAEILSGDYIKKPDTMVVSTLHDLKGFEFNLVIIVGCEQGSFPARGVHQDEVWRDALRLYVAMTRARDQVYLVYQAHPSPFVGDMQSDVQHREEGLVTDYQTKGEVEAAPQARAAKTAKPPKSAVARSENWQHWLTQPSLGLLRTYYRTRVQARQDYQGLSGRVLNDRLEHQEQDFLNWLTTENLSRLRARDVFRFRNVGRKHVEQLAKELRAHGVDSLLRQ